MALVSCSECNHQVSSEANTCPSCGFVLKPLPVKKKKTGFFTKLISFFFFLWILGTISRFTDTSRKGPNLNKTNSRKISNTKTKVNLPKWETSASKDEMTGKKSFYASSPSTKAIRAMAFPYHDIKSWVGVGCNESDKWVYFGFNEAPNLLNTQIGDGYNDILTRVKWDNKVDPITLKQKWSSKFLHIRNLDEEIGNLQKANKVKLELEWHGNGSVFFEYSLSGSTAVIKQIFNKCNKL